MKRLLSAIALSVALILSQAGPVAAAAEETASATVAKSIPYKKQDSATGEAAGRSLAILAVLLGLACAGLFAVKRYFPQLALNLKTPARTNGSRPGRRLKLIETMRLNPRVTLYLVQLDDRMLLLAQSGDNLTTVVNDMDVGSGLNKNQELANDV